MKLFNKDFILVLIGQIISLFGNSILRFALPLYMLNITKSASLFGIVSACSFIPMIFATPIGGLIADRINKRNIMVFLDFLTASITCISMLLMGRVNLVILILICLILLYSIQGIYQPTVQASIPFLVPSNDIIQANASINLVASLANLIGPVIGGILFGFWGIIPILYISGLCFFAAAIMEMFINIPSVKKHEDNKFLCSILTDMKDSFTFMIHNRPEILKMSFIISVFNLLLSACAMIGLPIVITQNLGLSLEIANRLYGYVEGAMGAGSLIGGILAGVLAKNIKIRYANLLIIICSLTFLPIAVALSSSLPVITTYVIITASSFFMMMLASFFSIQLMSCLQILTPNELLGKVISCAMCIVMCATPLGQAIYGIAFQHFSKKPQIIFLIAMIFTIIIGLGTTRIFRDVDKLTKTIQRGI
ncbi:MFS transporter [Clostridium butyricum]|uniref:MFS transporter n=1 Tax=Clostridium butyricum TaxID=1492 RepID=UPI0013D306D8|nr:MFS transporter [Clostridium butyricum]MCQ2012679.1 MFS transporter [Clostridium butyricum]MCQ2017037.1 MFS transporter [Clostridium butyricum]MCQ2020937.1 MFS transporter [Clostridium butyricum]MCQ2025089.1 MFS transporter [Clostridium butyricum]NFB72079.1 MFS transporter [Clostridium butyricum]